MNVTSRAVPTLAFLLLAALATACGVEGGGGSDAAATASTVVVPTTDVDEPATTTTEPEASTTTTEPDAPTTTKPAAPTTAPTTIDPGIGDLPPEYQDQVLAGMVDAFVEGGLTQEQAQCLADTYGRDILDGADIDLGDASGMLKYFTDCGVDPNQL